MAFKMVDSELGTKNVCNCAKSQCLKLYCSCFANGQKCVNCNCENCHNNEEFYLERQRKVLALQLRNPNTFKSKISVKQEITGIKNEHIKGCKCARSKCLKKYCECFKAKAACSECCACTNCHNKETKELVDDLACPKKVCVENDKVITTPSIVVLDYVLEEEEPAPVPTQSKTEETTEVPPTIQRASFIDPAIIETATACMMTRASYCEKLNMPPHLVEREVLAEFNRCFTEMLNLLPTSKSSE